MPIGVVNGVNSFFLLRTANESFIKMAGTCRNIKGTSPVLDCGARLHRWDGWHLGSE